MKSDGHLEDILGHLEDILKCWGHFEGISVTSGGHLGHLGGIAETCGDSWARDLRGLQPCSALLTESSASKRTNNTLRRNDRYPIVDGVGWRGGAREGGRVFGANLEYLFTKSDT